ncbi:MAG: hypothetical protein ACOH5I_07570 [Oligoflexus sp.]
MRHFIKLGLVGVAFSILPALASANPVNDRDYQTNCGSYYEPECNPGYQPGYDNDGPGYVEPGFIDQYLLVDASRDLVEALYYATRVAQDEVGLALTAREAERVRRFSDRISNTRHYVDADVVNALRAGASPEIALRLLRDLDPNFFEIEQLAAELPYLSPNMVGALDEVFNTRASLIRLLTGASY